MRDIFSIIVMVMEIIVSAIGIVEFLVKRNTKKLVEAIIVILVIAGVAIVFLKYESRINGIIEKYLKTQENDITEETTENDEKFNPDYEPGKENIIENSKYINNNGMIAVQDKKIYIATYDKIVKMNIDYTELEDVIDVMASNLNVLGDWIYYCQDDGIYKVRTDGKYNERLIELSTYAYEMIVRDNGIYFINREDMKLYFMCNDGTKLHLISDDTMITFSFINYGSTLVYTKIDMEYNEDGKLSGYRPMAVYAVNGDNKMLVLEYEMGDYGAVEDPPMDICDYKENFVYCNYFGLFIRDALTFDVKKLTDIGGTSLCVDGEYAYYSGALPNENASVMSMGNIICVNLVSGEVNVLGKPFEENKTIPYIFPVGSDIIISNDRKVWYRYANSELERIDGLSDGE